MPPAIDPDGSEDVNDFLQRIKELGDQRDREDEERTRKLEEEIRQGRKERQARRAERARSLSPTKDTSTHANTPGSAWSNQDRPMLDGLSKTPSLPQPPATQISAMDRTPQKADAPISNTTPQESLMPSSELPRLSSTHESDPTASHSAATAPLRSNPLSWQQRPSSRGSVTGSVRSRPSSAIASDGFTSSSPRLSTGKAEPEVDDGVSKNQITQSLGAKDPAFFRQTQDRGLGSAAFRRNQVEDADHSIPTGRSMKLPGMSREDLVDPKDQINSSLSSRSMNSRPSDQPVQGSTNTSVQSRDSASVPLEGSFRLPLSSSSKQRFDSPQLDSTRAIASDEVPSARRAIAMSPSQGRLSQDRGDRPTSPTKGLGGFVQSAMMKRSDSVNKRWSAQPGSGLSRGNSVTSAVGSHDVVRFPAGGVTPVTISRQSSTRETTPSVSSRPTSSQSNLKAFQSSVDDESTSVDVSSEHKSTSLPPNASGSKESTPPPDKPVLDEPVTSPISSLSKRWSPTKSSWLGNAISKPESPRILSPAMPQQPAWMADLNRNKQQRGSMDLGTVSKFDKVTVGGFVRSPPPGVGYKSPSLDGPSSSPKPELHTKSRTQSFENEHQRGLEQVGSKVDLSSSSTAQKPSDESGKNSKSPATGAKTKPETPPKKDFRSNLKPQQPLDEAKGSNEPEFRNVFGKLKKTQTQNYVAPDELKDNIMRGKTGLAKTGGPQKSIVRDEFKESILKKKEKMNVPTASTTISSASSKIPDTSTPEAIAKRRGLGRSESSVGNSSDVSIEDRKPAPKPEALSRFQTLQEKPRPATSSARVADQRSPEESKPVLGGGFASSLAGILQKGPPSSTGPALNRTQVSQDGGTSAISASNKAGAGSKQASGPELTHATKGRARGPKRKLPSSVNRESTTNPETVEETSTPTLNENKPVMQISPQHDLDIERSDPKPLSIITDSRNNIHKPFQPGTPQKSSAGIGKTLSSELSPLGTTRAFGGDPSPRLSPAKGTNPMTGNRRDSALQGLNISTAQEANAKHQNLNSSKEVSLTSSDTVLAAKGEKQGPTRVSPSVKGIAGTWSQSEKFSQSPQPRSPIKLPTKVDEEAAMVDAGLRTKEVVGLGIEMEPQATQPSSQAGAFSSAKTPRSPPLPEKKPMQLQSRNEGFMTSTKVQSAAMVETNAEKAFNRSESWQRDGTAPLTKSPKSPPNPGRKPTTIDSKISTPPLPAPSLSKRATSPLKEPSESAALFADIFDEAPSKTKINVDTQAVLNKSSSADVEKIKTLRKQILEISDNGKSVPVPSDQEHILFEDSLYLCTHVFGTSNGARKTEVYLWCGDGVSPSAIEDAQLFARKTAKDSGGKLVVLRQGKEPAIFFQALGGIVITRRGLSSRSDSATYMLCGRRHLGQIAFDEVDFNAQSLCVGFPYIISARGGSLYLWKGNGASADELGCARLIGMDLGLTGEIEEIDVGKETTDFWSSFSTDTAKPDIALPQGKHWHLKPACEKYANKLFEIDVEYSRPKSSSGFMSWGRRGSAVANDGGSTLEARIKEVTPYSQADLIEEGVYVLDAFFEIFVIFRLRTSLHPAPQHRSTKSSTLRAALLFAQDYGILAASVEDRPFVPQSFVVILSKSDGSPKAATVPEGLKTCFRKWTGDGIGQEDVQILPLAEALAAEEN